MQLAMYQVDAFTNKLFKGNSAAVIELEEWLDEHLMLAIARENNLSETAFFVKRDTKYHIRWFSPLSEIDFCGHATLASAFVLFLAQPELQNIVFFAQAIGRFEVNRAPDGYIEMRFPAQMPKPITEVPSELSKALNISPKDILRNRQAYFAIYEHADDVKALVPDLELLKLLAPYDVVVSAPDQTFDFISRYFWPANGGDEDPVTGSIHCGLAPYWSQQLNKTDLTAYQASQRGGTLCCQLDNDMVIISGQAVLYMTATITI